MRQNPVNNNGHISSADIREIIISKKMVCDEASVTLSKCRAMMETVDSNFAQYRAKLESKKSSNK